jgi:hypothetical protein
VLPVRGWKRLDLSALWELVDLGYGERALKQVNGLTDDEIAIIGAATEV